MMYIVSYNSVQNGLVYFYMSAYIHVYTVILYTKIFYVFFYMFSLLFSFVLSFDVSSYLCFVVLCFVIDPSCTFR